MCSMMVYKNLSEHTRLYPHNPLSQSLLLLIPLHPFLCSTHPLDIFHPCHVRTKPLKGFVAHAPLLFLPLREESTQKTIVSNVRL